jgi:hypothetical protein
MTDRFTPSAIVIVLLLIGGTWLANAHTHVAAQVNRIDAVVSEDHDARQRNEAQLEYLAKILLLSINDQRAASGKPLVPDEFPRGGE